MNDIAKKLYNLEIHEELELGCLTVYRVPGGWIYTELTGDINDNQVAITSTFVPWIPHTKVGAL